MAAPMKNKTTLFMALVIVALLFLWLRENAAKMTAETQFKNIQYKATSMINEKGNAINELETQLTELQVKLQDVQENCQKAQAAKEEEMNKLTQDFTAKIWQLEEEVRQKNKGIDDLEIKMKENSERFDKALKKKNTEISGMGEELRKSTERLAAMLKKQESIESDNFSQQAKVSELERQVQKYKTERTQLEGLLKAVEEKPAPLS
jgi:chromosome segregation ATPase